MKYALLFAPLLAGCIIGDDNWQRPRDLPSSSIVDRPRILAIQLDPPEAGPGETVVGRALFPDPNGDIESRLWLGCPPEAATAIGCGVTQEDGFMGLEPSLPPSLTLPDTALDGLSEEEQLDGIYWTIQVLGLPPGALSNPEAEVDFNQVESASKRLVVSTAAVKNKNPSIVGFKLDDVEIPAEEAVQVHAGQSHKVEFIWADDAAEPYVYITRDGLPEDRVEEPYATWYSTDGSWFNPFSMYPYSHTDWIAPTEVGAEGSLWAVVRDRRGGIGWLERAYVVIP